MDNQILEKLYHLYGREILLFLFSICGNWSIAEDLQQETFLKALLSVPKNYEHIRAWLYKVARNLCYNYMKRENRIASENLENMSELPSGENLLEQYIEKERFQMLYKGLLKLAAPKREVLELQYFGNFTLKQIAQIMGLSYENVRVLKMRAKTELKKILEEDGYEIL